MNISETIGGIKRNENKPRGIENAVFIYSIKGSDLLYMPTEDENYNQKHELECVIFSTITHILWIEVFYPNLFEKIRTVVNNNLYSLIKLSEPLYDFMDVDFINGYFERFKFYGEELSKLSTIKNKMPWKMLELIYDVPLSLDIRELITKEMDYDISTKMPQFIKLTNYIDFVYENLPQLLTDHKNQL